MNDHVRSECVYLSDSWGIHDQRWCAALETLGFSVFRELIPPFNPNIPIITGPLTTISSNLLSLPNPIIGLSWGFDLHELHAANNTTWLAQLTGIIVDSQPTWEIARTAGFPTDHIVMIPWGIDLTSFVPHRDPVRHSRLRILTLRAHEPLYNVETVINAVKILHDRGHEYELVIGNTGSRTDDLMRHANYLGLKNVNFIGKVNESELPRYFNEADVYVSAAQTDGTSVTLLQAMCMKIPVVVSDSPGNAALLTPIDDLGGSEISMNRGTLFHTGSAESLADALTSLQSHESLFQDKVNAAWEYVQANADWNRNIHLLLPLLREG